MGLRMTRPELDRCRERRQRAIEVSCPPARGAEMVLRVEECGTQLNRALELGDRFGGVSLLAQDEPEEIVRLA